jgi:hypothetical protein
VDKVIGITNLDGTSMHNLRIRNNQKWGEEKKESLDIREYKKNLARHKVQGEDDCA